jgi:hypothetical protein
MKSTNEAQKSNISQNKKAKRIRRRKSYALFKDLWGYLMSAESTPGRTLRTVYSLIDDVKGWGTTQAAKWAEESMRQVIEDCEKETALDKHLAKSDMPQA